MGNTLLYLIQTVITLALVLTCFRLGKAWLVGFVSMAAVLINLAVLKQMQLFGLAATGGNVLYASIFFATDLLDEYWGPREAQRAVRIGLLGGLLYLGVTQMLLLYAPNASDFGDAPMRQLFGLVPRIVLGSLTAYAISQHLDVWLFERIRRRTGEDHLWLRNNGSTWFSQAVDTLVFHVIAFAGVPDFPLWEVSLITYLLKVVVAAFDTPFIYLSRRFLPGELQGQTRRQAAV
jgi:uncharacterized integral membrane protein (TIGR00697 family)